MQKKIKNVLIGTSIVGLLGATAIVANTINNTNEVITKNSREANTANKVVQTTTEIILTQEIATTLGWDTKTTITLEDWEKQAPNVVETLMSFKGNTTLTSIEIPAKIKTLGLETFSTSSLTKITFAKDSQLTNIGDGVFYKTDKLAKLELPKSAAYLGAAVFASSAISSLTFEKGTILNTIGANSFTGAASLLSIDIPASVKVVEEFAFQESSFTTISMPIDLQAMGMIHYGFTQEQWDVVSWVYPPTTATILNPEIIKTIGWDVKTIITLEDWKKQAPDVVEIFNAFENHATLVEIQIPDTITTITATAFTGTTLLTKISMHTSLKTPELNYGFTQEQWDAITWTSQLAGTVLNAQMVTKLGWDTKKTITAKDWEMVPNAVEIADDAFTNNEILTSIKIPNTIVTIGANSFAGTISLTKISMSISLETVGVSYGLTQEQWDAIVWIPAPKVTVLDLKLIKELGWDIKTSITAKDWEMVPDVINIADDAFTNNEILTSIEIPSRIMTIEVNSFAGTISLTKIIMNIKFKDVAPAFGLTQEQWDVVTWTYAPIDTKILKLEDLVLIGWDTKTSISLKDWEMVPNVVEISSAFQDNAGLISIEIPSRITIIGELAFKGATKLNIVTFQSNSQLETIGVGAFQGTSALKNIKLGFNFKLVSIGDLAFADSTITSIDLPSSVKEIGPETFLNSVLTNIAMDYSLAKDSLDTLYSLTQEQWDNVIWKNIPTTGLINSFIAKQLLKTNLKIDWDQISTYSGIDANAFANTGIVAITVDAGFDIDANAFANTPFLTNIILSPEYNKVGATYGLTSEQLSLVNWFSSSKNNSYLNNIITIVGITSGVVVLIAVSLVTYVSLRKRNV